MLKPTIGDGRVTCLAEQWYTSWSDKNGEKHAGLTNNTCHKS